MSVELDADICIVGLGPAGLGAAITLANSQRAYNVVCLEAGPQPGGRFCSVLAGQTCREEDPCHIIGGVGGCGTLGGSKISDFPAGRGLAKVLGSEARAERALQAAMTVLQRFVTLHGDVKRDELIEQAQNIFSRMGFVYRHYDSFLFKREDFIRGCEAMLEMTKVSGIRVLTETGAVSVTPKGSYCRVAALQQGKDVNVLAKHLVLAVGRLGHRLLASILSSEVEALQVNDHLDVGIRLEFPTSLWPDIDLFHNDLKLEFGNARTFCICKDGTLAPYRMGGVFLTEGSKDPARPTGFTNMAILVRKHLDDSSSKEMLVTQITKYLLNANGGALVRQTLGDFLKVPAKGSTERDASLSASFWRWGEIARCFPRPLTSEVREAVEYFALRLFHRDSWDKISVFAPELDYYWPKHKIRPNFSTAMQNVYLIGDCGGHFRGILQAFCSGILCAQGLLGEADAS